jgi:hypothetical protein
MDLAGLHDCDRLGRGSKYPDRTPNHNLLARSSSCPPLPLLILPFSHYPLWLVGIIVRSILPMPQIGHLRRQANSLVLLYLLTATSFVPTSSSPPRRQSTPLPSDHSIQLVIRSQTIAGCPTHSRSHTLGFSETEKWLGHT